MTLAGLLLLVVILWRTLAAPRTAASPREPAGEAAPGDRDPLPSAR
jgi:hypothetical protein